MAKVEPCINHEKRYKKIGLWLSIFALLAVIYPSTIFPNPRQPQPLGKAHSHNDYQRQRPLWAALDRGYTSVEADIHLIQGKLLVGHDEKDLKPEKTLQAMYLDPLRKRIQENQGKVFVGGPTQILLIDIKSDAVTTYLALKEILATYADILTVFDSQGKKEGAILVIISGNRPYEVMKTEKVRYAAMDGRLGDLISQDNAELVPMISDTWEKNFTWRGVGPMPVIERTRMLGIVQQAHTKGKWVRFWATPDKPSRERERVWKELLSAGVDFLNSDDLPALQRFMLKNGKASMGKSIRNP